MAAAVSLRDLGSQRAASVSVSVSVGVSMSAAVSSRRPEREVFSPAPADCWSSGNRDSAPTLARPPRGDSADSGGGHRGGAVQGFLRSPANGVGVENYMREGSLFGMHKSTCWPILI